MTKQEFIEQLRVALNGKVPATIITENVRYYEDYINTEIRKGKGEEEVMGALGDPRLIARTIITTSGQEEGTGTGEHWEYGRRKEEEQGYRRRGMPVWMWLIFGILVIVLIFSAVMSLLSLLWPILVPMLIIMAVMGVVRFFRDWMN